VVFASFFFEMTEKRASRCIL